MFQQIVLSIILFLATLTISAQNITGNWYEIENSKAGLEINISKFQNKYTGTYSWEWKDRISTVNAPLDQVSVKEDSLFVTFTQPGYTIDCKLGWNQKTETYEGFSFINSRKAEMVSFSRTPIERDLAQKSPVPENTTRQDSIRGMITPERAWWDLTYYHLEVAVEPDNKYISGKNTIQYRVMQPQKVMQIDLQPPLKLTKAIQNGKELQIKLDGNANYIYLEEGQQTGKIYDVEVFYEGHPTEAANAPWDGGFSWKRDNKGNHYIATTCQGIGASIWWPNKDHMYDEVDSMLISITNPKGLSNISNGQLRSLVENADNTVTSNWFVGNPINNYGVNVNIGDYVHFSEVYQGEEGALDMDYYVLRGNLEKAKKQFKDAPRMMKAFEHWFGPYPFYKDGYKLIEVPYNGMEHQSSVTYGNGYENGYIGRDLSDTGWGLKFDFIIIHESGHEWFANNITYIDMADMWIHESFTNYSESLFLDYHYGKKAASEYVIGTRKGILNDRPIIAEYGVNKQGSGDMYPKGGNMLHTLRYLIDDDEKWRQILRGINRRFYHQTVSGKQIEDYLIQQTGMDLKPFFDQYLRTTKIPTLEFYKDGSQLVYRWINAVEGFAMPIKVTVNQKDTWIYPKIGWTKQYFTENINQVLVDPNFYVGEVRYPELMGPEE